MERKQDGFVPLGDVNAGVELPDGRALTPAAPQARHHFTRLDQINQLVGASEADAGSPFPDDRTLNLSATQNGGTSTSRLLEA